MARFPNFIIIGAMKCATTTLQAQLEAQPGICFSELNEPEFFSDDGKYARGISWYRSLFPDASAGALCGERSTEYTKLPDYPRVVERIRDHLPDIRLVYVIRNPIDRLISHFMHEWLQQRLSEPLDVAIDKHPELTAWGLYSEQIEPYLAAFGRDQVLLVGFDRLISSPQAELERICRFIGYRGSPSWDFTLRAQNVSQERLQKTWVRTHLLDSRVAKTLRRRWIPRRLRERARRYWMIRKRPSLSGPVHERLRALFDEDLARLGRWLELDVTLEKFAQTVSEHPLDWSKNIGS